MDNAIDDPIERLTKIAAKAMREDKNDIVRAALEELRALHLAHSTNVADMQAERTRRGR